MKFWKRCLDDLENTVSKQEFRIWIMPLKVNYQGNLFTIYTPNQYFLGWVKSKYRSQIVDTIKKVKNTNHLIVKFAIYSSENTYLDDRIKKSQQDSRKELPVISEIKASTGVLTNGQKGDYTENFSKDTPSELCRFDKVSSLQKTRKTASFGSPIKKDYNFDSLVVGKANEVARAAAMEVSINLGCAYNPLFIYGGSGLGKTHLMHAIGNYVLKNSDNSKVLYVTSERFVKDYVDAVRLQSGDEFQSFYRSVDVLLVDDIQFIAGKAGSQEEFFHTFNTLLENGKQVVLSCDKYPKEIPKLEERLVSRFGYGLTVTIDIPDLETRTAILLHKARQFKHPIHQDIALFIAKNIRSNVRELEGALHRVLNYSQFNSKEIDEKLAYECLRDLISIQEKIVKIDNIQRIVADYYKIKTTDLLSKQKTRDVARPRQIAMALAKKFTRHSLPEIGNFFGGRDHTTVLHAVRTIKKLLVSNMDIQDDYQNLSRKLAH